MFICNKGTGNNANIQIFGSIFLFSYWEIEKTLLRTVNINKYLHNNEHTRKMIVSNKDCLLVQKLC